MPHPQPSADHPRRPHQPRPHVQARIVDTEAKVDRLLTLVSPLLKDVLPADSTDVDAAQLKSVDEDSIVDLAALSQLIQRIQHDDVDTLYLLLKVAHGRASSSANQRAPFVLAPLAFRTLGLARAAALKAQAGEKCEVSGRQLLLLAADMATALRSCAPSLAHRLFLQSAQTADVIRDEETAYELVTQVIPLDLHPLDLHHLGLHLGHLRMPRSLPSADPTSARADLHGIRGGHARLEDDARGEHRRDDDAPPRVRLRRRAVRDAQHAGDSTA